MPIRLILRLVALPALVLLATTVAACDSAGRPSSRSSGPAVAGSTVLDCDTTAAGPAVNIAVAEYVRRARPKPQRFLSSVGPGSTPMPESGVRALQDHGPTYLYPADTAGQATVRAKLAMVGPYTALLVTFESARVTVDGNEATIRLGGRYVGGTHEGLVAPTRAVRLRCEGATWTVATADEEHTT